MSRVIATTNHKDGVGKTATAVNLADCLNGAGVRGRGWRLFVAWVIVPPLLLCMAEMGLRLAGYGVSTKLFVARELRGETVCMPNRVFFQQFYTGPIEGPPQEFTMPAAKPPDTYRVFVFGSSAAEGWPAPDFSFSRILETMLHTDQHGKKTEIYRLALSAANSHVMRAAAKACAAYQPDLFLIYMGNNELCGSVTQTMGWDWLPSSVALPMLHLGIALNDLRLVQMLHGITKLDFDRLPDGSECVSEPEQNYQYYQANVNDMCKFAKAAGAQVILCTVGTRLREFEPCEIRAAALDSKAAQERDDAYGAGNRLREQGQFQEALAAYTHAAGIDSGHAGLAYGIACCHYALGEYADARSWFVRARELDKRGDVRGAGTRINAILRETAAARARDGVHLADVVQALADASPHGIEGPELFLDTMHLTFEGNYVLARSVLETLARMEPRLGAQGSSLPMEECRLRLAMTEPDLRDQLALIRKCYVERIGLPTKDSLDRQIADLDAQIGPRADDMRLDACRKASQIDPQNEVVRVRYVQTLMDKGDAADALEQAKILVADFPNSWEALRLLSNSYATTGDRRRAIEAIRQLLAWQPGDARAYLSLGELLYEEGQLEAALDTFRTSTNLWPTAWAHQKTALLLLKLGNLSGAVKAYHRGLELKPGNFDFFEEFMLALCDAGRETEAGREIGRWHPTNGDQMSKMAVLYEKAGQTQDALQLLESRVISSGGDAGSCTGLEQFLQRNASTVLAPAVWGRIAEKTPSDQVWMAYERCLGEGDPEKHLFVLRQLLQIMPGNLYYGFKLQGLLDDRAGRLEAAGDLPGAVDTYLEAIPLNAQNKQPVLRLEEALSKSVLSERRKIWEKAWKDNPGNALVAALCGSAREATGDVDGAKEVLAACQLLDPGDWHLCELAANALADAGAWNDAAGAYERALVLNPKLEYLRSRLEGARKFDADCFALQDNGTIPF